MGFLKTWLSLFCLAAAGCSNPPATVPTTEAATESDTTNYALDADSVKMTMNNATPPEGFYQVVLPCANCKGIEHTVLFNRDLGFRLAETVLGSETPIKKISGSWKPVKDDIWLYKDSSVVARYTWHGDTLNYIDLRSGVHIPLRPLPGAMDNEAWKNKGTEGVDFFGVGNEPFWNISIDEQKSIVFNLADWPKPVSFKPSKPVAAADSTVYQARKDSVTLRIVVYNTFCSDGMSDIMYPNKVKVQYNNTVYNGCGIVYK